MFVICDFPPFRLQSFCSASIIPSAPGNLPVSIFGSCISTGRCCGQIQNFWFWYSSVIRGIPTAARLHATGFRQARGSQTLLLHFALGFLHSSFAFLYPPPNSSFDVPCWMLDVHPAPQPFCILPFTFCSHHLLSSLANSPRNAFCIRMLNKFSSSFSNSLCFSRSPSTFSTKAANLCCSEIGGTGILSSFTS